MKPAFPNIETPLKFGMGVSGVDDKLIEAALKAKGIQKVEGSTDLQQGEYRIEGTGTAKRLVMYITERTFNAVRLVLVPETMQWVKGAKIQQPKLYIPDGEPQEGSETFAA